MRGRRWINYVLVVGLVGAALVSVVWAQGDGGYEVGWSTVDGGGGMFSVGGGYGIGGTVGQADAGVMVGEGYRLEGGFWGAGAGSSMYLPGVFRAYRP